MTVSRSGHTQTNRFPLVYPRRRRRRHRILNPVKAAGRNIKRKNKTKYPTYIFICIFLLKEKNLYVNVVCCCWFWIGRRLLSQRAIKTSKRAPAKDRNKPKSTSGRVVKCGALFINSIKTWAEINTWPGSSYLNLHLPICFVSIFFFLSTNYIIFVQPSNARNIFLVLFWFFFVFFLISAKRATSLSRRWTKTIDDIEKGVHVRGWRWSCLFLKKYFILTAKRTIQSSLQTKKK